MRGDEPGLAVLNLALATVAFTLIASGCLGFDGASPGESEKTQLLRELESFQQCNWTYPDGQPVPCDNQAKFAAWQAHVPADWICIMRSTDGTREHDTSTWRSPNASEYGIYYYNMPHGDANWYTLRVFGGVRPYVAPWRPDNGTSSGFIRFGSNYQPYPVTDPPRDAFVDYTKFRTDVESSVSELRHARVDRLWSVSAENGGPYLLYRMTAFGNDYYFFPPEIPLYRSGPVRDNREGERFNVTVSTLSEESYATRFYPWPWSPTPSIWC